MILSIRIMMFMLTLACLHIYYNIPYRKSHHKVIGAILWLYSFHNFIFIPFYLFAEGKYLYIEQTAPFPLFYGPLFLLYLKADAHNPLHLRKIVPHIIPILIALIAFFIFVFSSSYRETYYAIHFKFNLISNGLSFMVYAIYILYFIRNKSKLSDIFYFSWFLLLTAAITIYIGITLPSDIAEFTKETTENIVPTIIIFSFMNLGIILIFTWVLNIFKQQIMQSHLSAPHVNGSKTHFFSNEKTKSYNKLSNNQYLKEVELVNVFFSSQQITNRGLKPKDVAKKLKITQLQLLKIIQEEHYTSFSRLLNQKRIEYACKLLDKKDFKVESYEKLAIDCGYGSTGTFYRNFKEQVGMTPKEYKDTN